MKTQKLKYLLIVFVSFLLSLIVTYNYTNSMLGRKIQDLIGLYIFFFLTIVFLKLYNKKLNKVLVLISIMLGSLFFLLPYALTHLPWQMIMIIGLVNLITGSFLGYLFFIYKSLIKKSIIILILLLYSIFYFFILYVYVWGKCVSII